MKKIEIKYNPFLVETEVTINGKIQSESSRLFDIVRGRRLQEWLDPFLDMLPKVVKDNDIDICFKGTRLDAEDLKQAVSRLKNEDKDINITVDISASKDVTCETKITELRNLLKQAKEGPFSELIESMEGSFNKALNPDFEVTVLATMSAGKSTLVNAMLGTDLMPAANEATTATIVRIEDCDDHVGFSGCRRDEGDDEIDGWQPVDAALIAQWNKDERTSQINIRGNIASINQGENVRLVLLDTPGPNNSRNSSHAKTMKRAITSKPLSMVLYVMDSTNYQITDAQRVLAEIKETMDKGGRLAHDRFIFVANKIDHFDPETDSPKPAVDRMREFLEENGIQNPMVIPVSAQLAKLIRKKRFFGEATLTSKERRDLSGMTGAFIEEKEMDMISLSGKGVGAVCHANLIKKLMETTTDEEKAELLSGVPVLEELLQRFLHKHALPIKIRNAVDTLGTMMKEADAIRAVNIALNQNESELEKLRQSVEKMQADKSLAKKATAFREKLERIDSKPSQQISNHSKKLLKELEDFFDKNENEFLNDISPYDAEKIVKEVQSEARSIVGKFEADSDDVLNRDYFSILEKMHEDYQKNVQDFLEKDFPEMSKSLRSVCEAKLKMPNVKELVFEATHTYERFVGRGGFLWLKKKYETIEEVNGIELWEAIKTELRNHVLGLMDSIKSLAVDNVANAKNIILKEMSDIDQRLEQVVTDLQKAIVDKKVRECEIADNLQKLDWVAQMQSKLLEILSL